VDAAIYVSPHVNSCPKERTSTHSRLQVGYASGRLASLALHQKKTTKESEPSVLVHGSRTKSSLPYYCYAYQRAMDSIDSASSNDQFG
jgi:hypothetical protein